MVRCRFLRETRSEGLALLHADADPGDDAAFLRTVNSPKRGFGPKKADALKVLAMREGISYYEALKRHIDEKPFNTKAIPGVCGGH